MTIDHTTQAAGPAYRPPRGFLTGRTALVTGAARRIGRTLALALADEGAQVVLHHRTSTSEAAETAATIVEGGGSCVLIRGDLADADVAGGLVDSAARAAAAAVDILVNNASIFPPTGMADAMAEEWDRIQAVNLRAPFLLAQGLARQLPTGAAGDIVSLGDIRVLRPGSDHAPYTVSKSGLHGLTRSLAVSLAPRIRVNELLLGPVLPPETPGGEYEHVPRESLPTRRFPRPEDVAAAMLFVLGNPAVTGQSLCIDGGQHLL
ncbi:short-chain dehydrogenase [bacterium CG_4_9_14_3_um_filter_65_15]|nr:MAG: short-chain dehydrogenase [bacterium CG_4_9_14_3_um_filter_65_15]